MWNRLFNSQTKTISSAAGILGLSALISKILGLFRDRLLAGYFGAGSQLDIYFASFRIPDLVYNILIAGGIVVAFLPLFSKYFSKDKETAWQFTNCVLNIFLFLLILISLVLSIFTPFLIKIIAPGFNLEQKTLAIALTRLMFLSPIFFGLSSIFSGVLHYFNRFLIYSLCPILYNLGIIFGIIFLTPLWGVFGVALGVILGAFFHMAIQIPSVVNCGFRYRPIFNFRHPGIKKVFFLMVPRIFGMASQQINLIVITAIASTLSVGSIAIFNFSNNLQYLPIGIIGIPFATASFPILSRFWVDNEKEKFIEKFSSIFCRVFYLIIPVSILMILLRAQIVRLILGTGQFGWLETRLTAASLGLFCLGTFAIALIPLIFRVFFAFQDTKTPTLIAISAMFLNIGLSFVFTWFLKFPNFFRTFMEQFLKLEEIEDISVIGLPLAFSIAGIFQFILLLFFLYKKIGDFKLKEICNSCLKIISASILMSGGVYFTLHLIAPLVNMQTFLGVLIQSAVAGLTGIFIYFIITWALKSPELKAIVPFLKRIKK